MSLPKRYILIGGWKADEPVGKAEITKEDLALVKNKDIDWLIDTLQDCYFDAEANEWKELK